MKFSGLFILLAAVSCAQNPTVSDAKNTKTLAAMAAPSNIQLEKVLTKDVEINGDKVAITAKVSFADAGKVCVQAQVQSSKMVDYSAAHWSSRLEVDGKVQKTAMIISPLQLIGGNDKLAGEVTIHGCTTAAMTTAEKVTYVFKDHRHRVLATFEWQNPRPATGAASL